MTWQNFSSPERFHSADQALDQAGQRIQILQARGSHVIQIADLVSLKVELLTEKADELSLRDGVIYGLVSHQNPWAYQENPYANEEERENAWKTGGDPSIQALINSAWFLDFKGPSKSEGRKITMGKVGLRMQESAEFGLDSEKVNGVSEKCFTLDPIEGNIQAQASGLFLRRSNLETPPQTEFKGSPIELPPSASSRVKKPGDEKTILQALQERDQETMKKYYAGFQGSLRLLVESLPRTKTPPPSHWIVGQTK